MNHSSAYCLSVLKCCQAACTQLKSDHHDAEQKMMDERNRPDRVEVKQQQAAENAADREHPSHYEARKAEVKSERELRREAVDQENGGGVDASKDETEGFRNVTPSRAQPPEDFTARLEVRSP